MSRLKKKKKTVRIAAAVLSVSAVLCSANITEAQAASHSTNSVPANGNTYYFKNSLSGGNADKTLSYGKSTDEVYVGDWNGDGKETLCIRRGNVFYFKNSLSGGSADITMAYGKSTDVVLVGDWDGDGKDSICLKRGNAYYFKNSLSGGSADKMRVVGYANGEALVGDWDGDGKESVCSCYGNQYQFLLDVQDGGYMTFSYGKESDTPLVGDWDGDGIDTLCVKRGQTYYFKNSLNTGAADKTVSYGKATDIAYSGDWNGNGKDSIMLRRGNKYYFKNSLSGGNADRTIIYSKAYDGLLVGDWDGNGTDTICARRVSGTGMVINNGASAANVTACNNTLEKLPQWILDKYVASGWTISIQPGDIGAIYLGKPASSTTYTIGASIYADDEIVIKDSSYAATEATLHEVGHWCDYITSVGNNSFYSDSQEFKSVYNAEYQTFLSKCTRWDFNQTETYEICAEAFEVYFTNPGKLKTYCPGLYAFVEKMVNRLQ